MDIIQNEQNLGLITAPFLVFTAEQAYKDKLIKIGHSNAKQLGLQSAEELAKHCIIWETKGLQTVKRGKSHSFSHDEITKFNNMATDLGVSERLSYTIRSSIYEPFYKILDIYFERKTAHKIHNYQLLINIVVQYTQSVYFPHGYTPSQGALESRIKVYYASKKRRAAKKSKQNTDSPLPFITNPAPSYSYFQNNIATPLPYQMALLTSNVHHTFFYAEDAVPKDG
jgi:hypothetical protein